MLSNELSTLIGGRYKEIYIQSLSYEEFLVFPKYVISMTPLLTRNDDNGITHLHLRKFLKEGF